MNKKTTDEVPESGETPALALADYKVVGLKEGQKEVFVPLVNRSYVVDKITPAQFEMLHRLGWPHVEKTKPA